MHPFRSSDTVLTQLLRVAVVILHQNCVSLPPVAEAFRGLIWDKNSSDFVKIFSIESFDKVKREYSKISRDSETHDFHGAEFKFTSFAIRDLVNFETNEFNETAMTGVHGEMWQTLASMLNFRLLVIKSRETALGDRDETTGDWDGLMGLIHRNETDIIPRCMLLPKRLSALELTLATWSTGYRFYMKNEVVYQRTWMADLFSPGVWLSIIGLFFAVVFANYIIHAYNYKYNKNSRDSAVTPLTDHFFFIFSIFCVQGWLPSFLDKNSKILLLSSRVLAWLLFIAFGAKLISHITSLRLPEPFTNIDSFYKNTDHKLLIKQNSFISTVFKSSRRPVYKKIIRSGRLIQATTSEIYDTMCKGKYVYLEAEDVAEVMKFDQCKHNVVGRVHYTTWIASGLVRGFKYRRTIDLGILKLHQYGIINRLRSKWLKKSQRITTSDSFETIRIEQVSLIFAMLFGAVVLSLVILLIENIMYLVVRKNRRKRLYY